MTSEDLTLTLKVGEQIKMGKFKNKSAVIKSFGKDAHNQPVAHTDKGDVNILKFRLVRLMEANLKDMKIGESIIVGEDMEVQANPNTDKDLQNHYSTLDKEQKAKKFKNIYLVKLRNLKAKLMQMQKMDKTCMLNIPHILEHFTKLDIDNGGKVTSSLEIESL